MTSSAALPTPTRGDDSIDATTPAGSDQPMRIGTSLLAFLFAVHAATACEAPLAPSASRDPKGTAICELIPRARIVRAELTQTLGALRRGDLAAASDAAAAAGRDGSELERGLRSAGLQVTDRAIVIELVSWTVFAEQMAFFFDAGPSSRRELSQLDAAGGALARSFASFDAEVMAEGLQDC